MLVVLNGLRFVNFTDKFNNFFKNIFFYLLVLKGEGARRLDLGLNFSGRMQRR